MTFSILIPTLAKRAGFLRGLLVELKNQIGNSSVEILTDTCERSTTGMKRNALKDKAKGKYLVYFDDDDFPGPTYIQDIIQASELDPDVITFNGYMTTNGRLRENFIIRLGERYEKRGSIYYRYPNHICPMKSEAIKDFYFPNITIGEDYAYATKIHNAGVLKTEVVINKDLYHYRYLTNK